MQIKKNTLMMLVIVAIVAVAGYTIMTSGDTPVNGNTTDTGGDKDYQEITLSLKNFNYYPNTINVKQGQPVRITLDASVQGCYRSFNIKELGVSKYSSNPNQKIEFTPTKAGTFAFACSMGMGYGKIVVS